METPDLPEIWRREVGLLQPRSFAYRVGGSKALVERLDLYGKLHGHKGCVNTVHFSPSGDILVSGSDDKDICFWNWSTKSKILTYDSGHNENVFQAQVMPFTDDRIVVTSAADGQIMEVNESGRDIRSGVALSGDVITHVLMLQRRQALIYHEATPTEADSDSDSTPEEGSPADPSECNIS